MNKKGTMGIEDWARECALHFTLRPDNPLADIVGVVPDKRALEVARMYCPEEKNEEKLMKFFIALWEELIRIERAVRNTVTYRS